MARKLEVTKGSSCDSRFWSDSPDGDSKVTVSRLLELGITDFHPSSGTVSVGGWELKKATGLRVYFPSGWVLEDSGVLPSGPSETPPYPSTLVTGFREVLLQQGEMGTARHQVGRPWVWRFQTGCGDPCQHSGVRNTQTSVSSRPTWSTQQVPDQSELYSETVLTEVLTLGLSLTSLSLNLLVFNSSL